MNSVAWSHWMQFCDWLGRFPNQSAPRRAHPLPAVLPLLPLAVRLAFLVEEWLRALLVHRLRQGRVACVPGRAARLAQDAELAPFEPHELVWWQIYQAQALQERELERLVLLVEAPRMQVQRVGWRWSWEVPQWAVATCLVRLGQGNAQVEQTYGPFWAQTVLEQAQWAVWQRLLSQGDAAA